MINLNKVYEKIDATLTVDNRWFKGEGRSDILDTTVNILDNIKGAASNFANDVVDIYNNPLKTVRDLGKSIEVAISEYKNDFNDIVNSVDINSQEKENVKESFAINLDILQNPESSEDDKSNAVKQIDIAINTLFAKYKDSLDYDINQNIIMNEKSKNFMLYLISFVEGNISNR